MKSQRFLCAGEILPDPQGWNFHGNDQANAPIVVYPRRLPGAGAPIDSGICHWGGGGNDFGIT